METNLLKPHKHKLPRVASARHEVHHVNQEVNRIEVFTHSSCDSKGEYIDLTLLKNYHGV